MTTMADEPHTSVRRKVAAIFAELVGDRAERLDGNKFPAAITSTITAALTEPDSTDAQVLHADQIAFHLTDWNSDAAFLVALHLFPERFLPEEIEAGVQMFLLHVPSHVATAAKLAGHPVEDIFGDATDA
jgi:hypothetical protein